MKTKKSFDVLIILIFILFTVFFSASFSFADSAFLFTEINDKNKPKVDIKHNKSYITFVIMKDGKFSSEKIAIDEYCKKKSGIVVTNIQGVDLKTDTMLCRCVTIDNSHVFIVRYKDGKIKVLSDNEGNFNIEDKLSDKNLEITGIQFIPAKETSDGRLELIK
jgi:hypothetical protein